MKYADSRFVSNPGDPIKTVYAPKVGSKGTITLVAVGAENIQEKINSFRDATDIKSIVARYRNTGDAGILQQRIGQYGDFTAAPSTLAEALQMQIDSNRLYDALPSAIKESFGNDRNVFFAMSGTKEWYEKMDSVLPESMRIKKVDNVTPVQPVSGVKE